MIALLCIFHAGCPGPCLHPLSFPVKKGTDIYMEMYWSSMNICSNNKLMLHYHCVQIPGLHILKKRTYFFIKLFWDLSTSRKRILESLIKPMSAVDIQNMGLHQGQYCNVWCGREREIAIDDYFFACF